MNLLAIDTASHLCAACVQDTEAGRELGRAVRDIGKGHAEVLMEVIGEALEAAAMTYADLDGIAVSVGPGSFTGIRVGVATARGLALALKVPAIGITTLDVLAFAAREAHPGRPALAALDAKRDEIYLASYAAGADAPDDGPRIGRLPEASAMADADMVLCGTAAPMIMAATGRNFDCGPVAATADIGAYARLAARRGLIGEKPRPLYLRAADAKPQQGFALSRREG